MDNKLVNSIVPQFVSFLKKTHKSKLIPTDELACKSAATQLIEFFQNNKDAFLHHILFGFTRAVTDNNVPAHYYHDFQYVLQNFFFLNVKNLHKLHQWEHQMNMDLSTTLGNGTMSCILTKNERVLVIDPLVTSVIDELEGERLSLINQGLPQDDPQIVFINDRIDRYSDALIHEVEIMYIGVLDYLYIFPHTSSSQVRTFGKELEPDSNLQLHGHAKSDYLARIFVPIPQGHTIVDKLVKFRELNSVNDLTVPEIQVRARFISNYLSNRERFIKNRDLPMERIKEAMMEQQDQDVKSEIFPIDN